MPAVEVWPRAVVPPAFVAARIMDILRSGVEVGEDGEHAAVVVIGGGRPSLPKMLLMCLLTALSVMNSRPPMRRWSAPRP